MKFKFFDVEQALDAVTGGNADLALKLVHWHHDVFGRGWGTLGVTGPPMIRGGTHLPHRVRRSYPSESAARRTRPLIPSSPGQQALDGADDSTETGISKAVSRSRSPVTVRVGSPSVWKGYSSSGGTDAPLPFSTSGVGETESSRFTGASFDSSQAAQTRCGTVRRGRPQTALPTHPPRRFFLPCCRHLSLVCR